MPKSVSAHTKQLLHCGAWLV